MSRRLGPEALQTYLDKLKSGFFMKYMQGVGLDIGYRGSRQDAEPILDSAIGVELDYPGYDGLTLPFKNESQDYVFSCHCLEHLVNVSDHLGEWWRVLKTDGYLVIIVPHQFLYEKKKSLPSKWNEDHKHFFTPARLLQWVELFFIPNTYRVRMCEDGDRGFNYKLGPDQHSGGQYEITLVLQKIKKPDWSLE